MPNPILAPSLAALPGIRHGFFTREGGVSEGIYSGLNVGLGSGDRREHVLENRSRVAGHLGFAGAKLNTLHQVHSADTLAIDRPLQTDERPRADGLVTRTPGVIVGALAADCCPILFADPDAGIVAAAHAGWRGALAGVAEATVARMESLGASRARIRSAIGPTIGQACYEVGPEFEATFLAADPANAAFFKRPAPATKPRFDLPGYVASRLGRLGLAAVDRAALCTYANESRFFSFRRATHRDEGDYGRQISAIVVA